MADENAQDESVYENNETLTVGSISRSAKRKEFREDSDYISPKRQRKRYLFTGRSVFTTVFPEFGK